MSSPVRVREALTPHERYQRAWDALLRQVDRLEEDAVGRVTEYLVAARRRIVEQLGQLPEDAWLTQYFSRLKTEVEGALRDYVARYVADATTWLPDASTLGVQAVDGPLTAAGITLMARVPSIDPSFVVALNDITDSLVKYVSIPASHKIMRAIAVGSLEGATPHAVQRTVAGILRTELRPDGTLEEYAAHAEMLVRTNLNGTFNRATMLRQGQFLQRVQQVFPDAEPAKVWLTAKDERVRDSHRRMDGQHVPMGDLFTLVSADGTSYKVHGPHDPRLPASQACNCRCRTTLWLDSVASILEGI